MLHGLWPHDSIGTPRAPLTTYGPYGPGLHFPGADVLLYIYDTHSVIGTNPDEWLFAEFEFYDVTGTQAVIGYFSNFNPTQYGRGLILQSGVLKLCGANNNGRVITTEFAPVARRRYVVAARLSNSGAIYINGKLIGTGNVDSGYQYMFGIGGGAGSKSTTEAGRNYPLNARVYRAGIFSGVLDNTRLQEISCNPDMLYVAPRRRVVFDVADGGVSVPVLSNLAASNLTSSGARLSVDLAF